MSDHAREAEPRQQGIPLIRVEGISKLFDARTPVLSDIRLDVREGEILALLGSSGCGKSTLLRIICGLLAPSSGAVLFQGAPVVSPVPEIALVFQSFALFPWLRVIDNVALGLEALGMAEAERYRRAKHYIRLVGLSGYERAYPKELSGGMKQRTGLARALAMEPKVLCMDEPFSALDVLTARSLRDQVLDIWQSGSLSLHSIILVTHSIEEAVTMADRVVILGRNPGRITHEVSLESLARPRPLNSNECQVEIDRIYSLIV